MYLIKEISEIADVLKEKYPKLSDYEALNVASKIQHNQLFTDAFVLNNSEPSVLEAMAIQLGFSRKSFSSTLPEAINTIAENINKLKD